MKQQDKLFMAVGGGVVTALAVITGIYLFGGNESSTGSNPQSAVSSANTSDTAASAADSQVAATSTTSFKDGTYSASVDYFVPHGSNTLTANVTIKDGKITAVTANDKYSDNESAMYIDSFENTLQSSVVGRDIGALSLSRIGGASLTTQAFNDALNTIRNNAKA